MPAKQSLTLYFDQDPCELQPSEEPFPHPPAFYRVSEALRSINPDNNTTAVKFATQAAPLRSKAGLDAPCDEEMAAVFAEVAGKLGGTFNHFTDASGVTRYDWQFHIPHRLTIEKMRSVMGGLGFAEFINLNFRSHRPTLPFAIGGFHWKGNVGGNWYHIEFRPTAWRSEEVYPVDAHYDADRPSFIFHRTAKGKRKCD